MIYLFGEKKLPNWVTVFLKINFKNGGKLLQRDTDNSPKTITVNHTQVRSAAINHFQLLLICGLLIRKITNVDHQSLPSEDTDSFTFPIWGPLGST